MTGRGEPPAGTCTHEDWETIGELGDCQRRCLDCGTLLDAETQSEETPGELIEEITRNPSDYLFAVRDAAGRAADALRAAIDRARKEQEAIVTSLDSAFTAAEAATAELDRLADRMEVSAELLAASDLEPNARAIVPGEAGLVRSVETPPFTLEQLRALPIGSWVRATNGVRWYRATRLKWRRRGNDGFSNVSSDALYARHEPLHLLHLPEAGESDA